MGGGLFCGRFSFSAMEKEGAMFQEEGYRTMGAAFAVYNTLGYGLSERIYHESLQYEFQLQAIPHQSRPELTVYYKDQQLAVRYRPDFVVCGGIVVEVKAVSELISEHEAQLFNYLRIARMHVGYLINFGQRSELQWKRFILTKHHRPTSPGNADGH
jgi:GxxExxY protein